MTKEKTEFVVLSVAESEELLAEELQTNFGRAAVRRISDQGYLVSCEPKVLPARMLIAFADQTLPNVAPVKADSISAWAELLFKWLVRHLENENCRWRLDILSVGEKVGPRRIKLIEQALDAHLQRHRRSLKKRRLSALDPLSRGDFLIQLCCTSLTEGYLSNYLWAEGEGQWGGVVWPSLGGILEVADDKQPPSRAFKKLEECLQRTSLSMQKGEVCVDLGAAPGSWTYVAAKRGAHVIAVDRAPLRDDLMRQRSVKFVKADAFKFKPEKLPVDWLLCDVVAFPERTLELLNQWCSDAWCRKFCVTFKFKGAPNWKVIAELKKLLIQKCDVVYLRRLTNNRNEICAWGACHN